MEQISQVHSVAIPQARPVAAEKVKSSTRLAYIDTIRMVLIILVIMVHAAVTYGSIGDWTFNDNTVIEDELYVILSSLFVLLCQSFFMSLFFFLSGYFTPGSYDRKGTWSFWKDRLLRLAIPMVLYTWFLSRIPNYLDDITNEGVIQSFWEYSVRTFWTDADGGPTWFLFALLAFCIGYTLWRLASRWMHLDLSWASRLPVPGTKALLALALVIGAAMFGLAQRMAIPEAYEAPGGFNLLLAFFPAYILMFAAGTLAYRNSWIARMPARLLRFWGWLSVALVVTLPVFLILGGAMENDLDAFFYGFTWQCAVMSLCIGLACVAFSTSLTLWMRDRVCDDRVRPDASRLVNKVTALAAPNTFTVYLIHPLVLVPFSYALSFVSLTAATKFILASAFTVLVSYLLAEGLRRFPGAKAIL